MIRPNTEQVATIASGDQTGNMLNLRGQQLVGVIPGDDLSGTQMYFRCTNSANGGTHFLASGGAYYSATVTAGAWNNLDAEQFLGVSHVMFDMTGTAQDTAVAVTAITRPI